MSLLLKTISIFGRTLNFNVSDEVFWLYVSQIIVVLIGLIVFFVLLGRTRRSRRDSDKNKVVTRVEEARPIVVKQENPTVVTETQSQVVVVAPTPEPPKPEPPKKPVVERVLLGITLDVAVVQRDFVAGDEFNCDGLLVRASYSAEPTIETISAYSVVNSEIFDVLSNLSEVKVCYVLKPDLSKQGVKFVTVKYLDQTAIYTISVREPVASVTPAPRGTIVVGEESVTAGTLRYDRSFEARYIQSDDDIKQWYSEIKNRLLSYKNVKGRISWKRETFKSNKDVVAKIAFRGNTLCLFLPLNAGDYINTKCTVEDVSKTPVLADTPAMIRIKNDKYAKFAQELITTSMKRMGIKDEPHYWQDFYVPYEGVVELINRGLIKREIKSASDEAIFSRGKMEDLD